jgi:hypothetical protein
MSRLVDRKSGEARFDPRIEILLVTAKSQID